MLVTPAILGSLFPETPATTLASFIDPLNTILAKYEINTPLRVAAFLAQVGHESAGFKHMLENLNYSAAGLLATFPRYFNATTAAAYQRQPEKIANHVYANRLGNGPESSGDGWKFRGHGLIQLTGKSNISAFAATINKDIDATLIYLMTPAGATEAAAWYWKSHSLNALADTKQITKITQVINGGTIGLEQRKKLYDKACELLVH